MSLIWQFFTVEDQADEVAKCNLCLKGIRRGRAGCLPKNFSTTPLHKHMKLLHASAYSQAQDQASRKKLEKEDTTHAGPPPKQRKLAAMNYQMTLQESFAQKKYWDINDDRSTAIHEKVMNMIAIDNQPFSIVGDQGFIELMAHIEPRYMLPSRRRYFSDVMLPKTYVELKDRISSHLDESKAKYISFTSDIWTSNHSVESFVSLTGHWIDEELTRYNGVLSAKHFPGSHTGENIAHMAQKMMTDWGISEERQHILVRDGTANMVLGLRLAEISSVHCFLHILDLIVKDSILSQCTIIDLCAKVRRIATHFNHSSLARENIKSLQVEHGIQLPLCPVQDVPTRWNSTYLMLERAYDLKHSLQIYTANNDDLPTLSANQWNLCEKILRILQPFLEITKKVSSEQSSLGDVIPHVVALDQYLTKAGNDSGVQTTKAELRSALRRRLLSPSNDKLNVKEDKNYVLSTVVDPRYKFWFLDNKETAKKWLLDEMQAMTISTEPRTDETNSVETSHAKGSQTSDKRRTGTNPPQTLKKTIHLDFIKCYEESSSDEERDTTEDGDESTQSRRNRVRHRGPSLTELVKEVEKYGNAPTIERDKDPLKFWKEERLLYPNIYLSCPASSVYSERLRRTSIEAPTTKW